MSSPNSKNAPATLDLFDRATHLLRSAPFAAWAAYAFGTIPFALGLLYFWGEMSGGAFAWRHCAPESLALGALFIWMKCWQSVFCRRLHGHLIGAIPPRWTAAEIFNLISLQAMAQSCALFLMPAAMLIVLPFGWLFAAVQSLTVVGLDKDGARATLRKAWRLASLWPKGNHLMLLILTLFSVFVWLNVAITMYTIPQLLKMLLGIETIFSVAGWMACFNSTFILTSLVIAYFCVDPLIKAAYVLRCFYGVSLASGEDLRVELAACRRAAALIVATLFLACSVSVVSAAGTPPPTKPPAPQSGISTPDLNRSIEKVLKRDEFTWRMPREQEPENDKQGWMSRFIESCADSFKEKGKAFKDWLSNLFPDTSPDKTQSSSSSDFPWSFLLKALGVVLIIAICCFIIIVFMRDWKRRRRVQVVLAETAVVATPNLEDENVVASQLPEDSWLRLAMEMMQKGDLRLALRAYYLACLAHLSQRQFIAIAKFKSNRDYETELRRRARSLPDLHRAFSDNGAIFDRVWYGLHQVTQEAVHEFQTNLERIRAC